MNGRLRLSRTHRAKAIPRAYRVLLRVDLFRLPASVRRLDNVAALAALATIPPGWHTLEIVDRDYGHQAWCTLTADRLLPIPVSRHPCCVVETSRAKL